ncbi:MAG: alpha amylase, partial [Clostridia bacterium]|nr:alpha amylase [Clostridia bacterium]
MKKSFIKIISLLLCIAMMLTLFAACKDNNNPPAEIKDWESADVYSDGNPYYKDYYQIFVYSYADSNGDGIGDLKGIEQKLDYIADLGFTGIWLSPVNPSPTYHKYDITDYEDIDKQFGTLDDFKSLVDKAHEKGISIMMDMVLNH